MRLNTVIYFSLIFHKCVKKKKSLNGQCACSKISVLYVFDSKLLFFWNHSLTEPIRSHTFLTQTSHSCQQKSQQERWRMKKNLCMSSKTYKPTPCPENKKSIAWRYILLKGSCDRIILSCFIYKKKSDTSVSIKFIIKMKLVF